MNVDSHSTLDPERLARQGFPEVIFCQGKTTCQIIDNLLALESANGRAFGTRLANALAPEILAAIPHATYHALARTISVGSPLAATGRVVAIVTAGTSDLAVSEEAATTLDFLGHQARRFTDLGVAGVHRILARMDEIREASVVIVVAGMEGALPSVVGGLVSAPVIAVPTSVGYGASFQGLAALLGMLNSCAAGLSVVNIDNGFGAAIAAHRILNTRTPS